MDSNDFIVGILLFRLVWVNAMTLFVSSEHGTASTQAIMVTNVCHMHEHLYKAVKASCKGESQDGWGNHLAMSILGHHSVSQTATGLPPQGPPCHHNIHMGHTAA
jgi:hypothetical protein